MSDPIDKLSMPASALAALAKAVPTDVLRDIARDKCPRAAMVAKWSPTADHAPGSNGTSWHVRPHFPIQINTYGDRTKWVGTSPIKLTFRFERS